jgi:lipopolysaccharide/colanic/teichoic acid biosynthesis glycosyltransferase
MLKRGFDIAFSVVVLLLLAPLLLAVALWVKLDSPGPVFFRQRRVGLRGREFLIYKFRTMRINAEAVGPQITIGTDPRITRSGEYLRKYKIDEFAQFFNVLIGDMSVVGPRPEVPRYVKYYPAEVKELVFSVRPGLTDWASIQFKDENNLLNDSLNPEKTYIEKILPAKLDLYVKYIRHCSFLGDLKIIVYTLKALVKIRVC